MKLLFPSILIWGWLIGFQSGLMAQAQDHGKVAAEVIRILEERHVSGHPFDDEISRLAFDNFVDHLDPTHEILLQEDIDQLALKWRDSLDERIMQRQDVSAAFEIYSVYEERLKTHLEFVLKQLENPAFDFESERTMPVRDKDSDWPKNAAAAESLWNLALERDLLELALLEAGLEDNGLSPASSEVKMKAEHSERIRRRTAARLVKMQKVSTEEVAAILLRSISRAYDAHSEFFSKTQYDNFVTAMRERLVGIGVMITSSQGEIVVEATVKGGPAEGKLRQGDRIRAIAEGNAGEFQEVRDKDLPEVVDYLRGEEGTSIRLQIIPADDPSRSTSRIVKLIRAQVDLADNLAVAELLETKLQNRDSKIGWIALPSFYTDMSGGEISATNDVRKLLGRLTKESVEAVVLDLRGNGGGSLGEAISLCGLFLPRTPVLQMRDARDRVESKVTENAAAFFSGPLMVLTDHQSAGASEIVAAALQDYHRALVVGEQTFGMDLVAQLHPINLSPSRLFPSRNTSPSGALKISIQRYYRITGKGFHKKGVIPDIVVSPNAEKPEKQSEPFRSLNLEVDEIDPASDLSIEKGEIPIGQLATRSKVRRENAPDFAQLFELSKIHADRAEQISLNAARRVQDSIETREKMERWAAERRSRFQAARDENQILVSRQQLTLDHLDSPDSSLPEIEPFARIPLGAASDSLEPSGSPNPGISFDPETGLSPEEREALEIMVDWIKMTED